MAEKNPLASGADPGGGGQGCLGPPPIFWRKKQGGQKPHTQKKKRYKSDNHEARYRLKRTQNTLNTLKFSK